MPASFFWLHPAQVASSACRYRRVMMQVQEVSEKVKNLYTAEEWLWLSCDQTFEEALNDVHDLDSLRNALDTASMILTLRWN